VCAKNVTDRELIASIRRVGGKPLSAPEDSKHKCDFFERWRGARKNFFLSDGSLLPERTRVMKERALEPWAMKRGFGDGCGEAHGHWMKLMSYGE
jgi:hypothetical protein